MIRLIASDLDGTLLEPGGYLPDGVFEMIEALTRRGIRFAAASGRQFGNLQRLFAPVSEKMDFICENGALCAAEGEIIGCVPLSDEDASEIICDVDRVGMNLLISGKHTVYIFDHNRKYTDDITYRLRNTVTVIHDLSEIKEPILKISGQIDSGVAALAPKFLEKWGHKVNATISGHDWFDFAVANKGMGIRMLMEHHGLQKDEVAAFGDNFNDETMLDSVGFPFLMEKADRRLRKPGVILCQKVLPVLRKIADQNGMY